MVRFTYSICLKKEGNFSRHVANEAFDSLVTICLDNDQGPVVRKPVNANPGL